MKTFVDVLGGLFLASFLLMASIFFLAVTVFIFKNGF